MPVPVPVAVPVPVGWAGPTGVVGLVRDPVLLGLLALTLIVLAAIVVGPGSVGGRVAVYWAAQIPIDVVLFVLCRRVMRLVGQPPGARRFWGTMSVAALLFMVGDLVQTVGAVRQPGPAAATAGLVQTSFTLAGVGCLVWVMLTLPTGTTGSARVRMWLDAAIVMAAAVVFAWYFALGARPGGLADMASALGGSALALVAIFAVVKLLLGGTAPFTVQAGFTGAASAVLLGVTTALSPRLSQSGHVTLLLVVRLLPTMLFLITPRVQELQVRANPAALIGRPTRPYSRLPYVALAATQALLLAILAGTDPTVRVWGVVAGVEVIIGLVVVRQLAAFSDNAQLLHRVRHQALHDPLTQLPNRLLFEERLRAALGGAAGADAVAGGAGAALLLIDLDDFKAVNDTLGHHVGDGLLVAVAGRLRGCARAGDTVTRLGGDEFGLLLPGAAPDVAAAIIDRVQAAFDDPVTVDGHQLRIQASIGLADGRRHDAEGLLRAADAAMYAAKRLRKGPARRADRGSTAGRAPRVSRTGAG